jgi:uncharacterized membrane protein
MEDNMDQIAQPSEHLMETPGVRRIGIGRPFVWLKKGLADFARVPGASLSYGVAFAAVGATLVGLAWGRGHIAPALTTGFLLVAPFLAGVLYDLSRQLERGGSVNSVAALHAWKRNSGSISLFGLLLALTLIMWERMSAVIFALFYGGRVPDLRNFVGDVLLSGHYNELLLAYLGVGGLIAAAVYAFSVVSLPMMLDRDVDVATAIVTSVQCVARNPLPMLVWALIIVVLMAIGFATWMIGLVVVFPWLGHASWHAYRDLVE